MGDSPASGLSVYTIGHSNHETDALLDLLRQHGIEVVVDVRSSPYSRFAAQFNREILRESLLADGFKYVYLGNEVGGRPQDLEYYDAEGHVLYGRVAASDAFASGIERLMTGISQYRVAMLCSEEDPTHCHRRLLISRVLSDRNVQVTHIRGNGTIQTEQELRLEAGDDPNAPRQHSLFGEKGRNQWRSTQSVIHRRPPRSSSDS